jgi:hypothetical protein
LDNAAKLVVTTGDGVYSSVTNGGSFEPNSKMSKIVSVVLVINMTGRGVTRDVKGEMKIVRI